MKQLCDELQRPNICCVGDVNSGATNIFGNSDYGMFYYPRTHLHTLVMRTTQLLGLIILSHLLQCIKQCLRKC